MYGYARISTVKQSIDRQIRNKVLIDRLETLKQNIQRQLSFKKSLHEQLLIVKNGKNYLIKPKPEIQ